MAKGDVYPSEKRGFKEAATGVRVVQLTNKPCVNLNAYYNQEQFIGGSEQFIFVSNRGGTMQLYSVEVDSGKITQLTDSDEPVRSRFTVDPRGTVYFGRGLKFLALDTSSLKEEVIAQSPEGCGPLSHPDLSSDGRYLVLGCQPQPDPRAWYNWSNMRYPHGREYLLILCDLEKRKQSIIYHGPSADNPASPGHHIFVSRGDPSYVWFGSYTRLQPSGISTIWFMRVDLERMVPIRDPMPLFNQRPFDWVNHYYSAPNNHVEMLYGLYTAHDRDGAPVSDQYLPMMLDVDLLRRETQCWVFPGGAPEHFKCNSADDMWVGDCADPGFLWFKGRRAHEPEIDTPPVARPYPAALRAPAFGHIYDCPHWPEFSAWIGMFKKHGPYLEVRPLVKHNTDWRHVHPHPVFSPDDRWVAYCSGDEKQSQVYVAEAVWPKWFL